MVNAVDGPARQIYVLDLVGEERLAGAVSLYEVILNLSRVLGPALGGVLLAISGPCRLRAGQRALVRGAARGAAALTPETDPARHRAAPSGRGPPACA